MKKRLIALFLILVLVLSVGAASAATWHRVNTTSLRVRYLPSESAKVLGSYRKDYALTIQRRVGAWAYVKFSNGFEGYVQSKYLAKASSYKAWIASDNVSLRKGPDGGFSATATLARGQQVSVLSHGSRYDYVSVSGLGTGYVMNGLLSRTKVKASGSKSTSTTVSGGGYDAWVLNAGFRKVNLRSYPNTNAPIIAQYSTGTKVRVLVHSKDWDKITVNGNTGYMMNKFLSTSVPAPTPTPKPAVTPGPSTYTAYVVSGNRKPVNVRKGAGNYSVDFKVPHGAQVTVLKHNVANGWDKIQYGSKTGYIMNSFLQLAKPAGAITPTPAWMTPTPKPASRYPRTMTVTSPNGKSVNVHKQASDKSSNVDFLGDHGRLSVGTQVTVTGVTKGWAHIEYGGRTGWMHVEFLK